MKAWLASDLSELGSHPDRRSACRRPCPDGGDRRRWQRRQACPGRGRGATENTVVVFDNRGSIRRCRGCSSSMARLHSANAIRNTFGVAAAIQRCQVHKGRNIIERISSITSSRRRSVRPGTRTTQTRPSGSCATWSGVWSMRNRASVEGQRHPSRPAARISWRKRSARCARGKWRHAEIQMDRRRPAGGPASVQGLLQLPIRNALQEHLRGSGRQCH